MQDDDDSNATRDTLKSPDTAAAHRQKGHGLISSSVVGSANRGRVLQALFDLGPTSRAELARHANVNRSTITGILQPLVDQGILVEGDPLPSNEGGGKPARPLWFAPDAKPICGVLLMHDSVRAALVSLDGRIEAEACIPFESLDAPQVELTGVILKCVQQVLRQARREPLGIGIAVGGMVDTEDGSIVGNAMTPHLKGLPISAELQHRLGLATFVDHHPRALVVGDRWFGPGRGRNNFAVLYITEGIGCALFLDGHLFRGPRGAGGELGHTCVQIDGALCRCGQRGCLETIASLGWLRNEARSMGLAGHREMNFKVLVERAVSGSSDATVLLKKYARNLAHGIANLQQVVAPNVFIVHGDVAAGGHQMLDAIAEEVDQLLPWHPGRNIELILGDPGYMAGLRGAAGLVLSEMLHFSP